MPFTQYLQQYKREFSHLKAPYTFLTIVGALSLGVFFLPALNKDMFYIVNALGSTLPDLWLVITYFGDGRFITCILVIVFWKKYNALLIAIFSALSVHLGVKFLKQTFEILRPEHVVTDTGNFLGPALNTTNFAFPSGHSAAISMCAFLLLRHVQHVGLRWAIVVAACIVALSRVIVGAHWPADVFAGLFFGGFIVLVFSTIRVQHQLIAGLVYTLCLNLAAHIVFFPGSIDLTAITILDITLGSIAALMCIAGFAYHVFGYEVFKSRSRFRER